MRKIGDTTKKLKDENDLIERRSGNSRTTKPKGFLLWWKNKCNQTTIQIQRKRMWSLRRLLFSVPNCTVLPKISNWSPYKNT